MTLPQETPRSTPEASDAGSSDAGTRKIIRFTELALCGDEIWIEYQGKLYRLQSTRQGKLVLTK